MTSPPANRVHQSHRSDYIRIVEFLKGKGLRNGEFIAAEVNVSRGAIRSMLNSGSLVKAGKDVKNRNIYRLTFNIEKEEQLQS